MNDVQFQNYINYMLVKHEHVFRKENLEPVTSAVIKIWLTKENKVTDLNITIKKAFK